MSRSRNTEIGYHLFLEYELYILNELFGKGEWVRGGKGGGYVTGSTNQARWGTSLWNFFIMFYRRLTKFDRKDRSRRNVAPARCTRFTGESPAKSPDNPESWFFYFVPGYPTATVRFALRSDPPRVLLADIPLKKKHFWDGTVETQVAL